MQKYSIFCNKFVIFLTTFLCYTWNYSHCTSLYYKQGGNQWKNHTLSNFSGSGANRSNAFLKTQRRSPWGILFPTNCARPRCMITKSSSHRSTPTTVCRKLHSAKSSKTCQGQPHSAGFSYLCSQFPWFYQFFLWHQKRMTGSACAFPCHPVLRSIKRF